MSIAEQQSRKAMEERVLQLEQRLEAVVQRLNDLEKPVIVQQAVDSSLLAEIAKAPPGAVEVQKPKKSCPKCGAEGKGYFFHTSRCKGPSTTN